MGGWTTARAHLQVKVEIKVGTAAIISADRLPSHSRTSKVGDMCVCVRVCVCVCVC